MARSWFLVLGFFVSELDLVFFFELMGGFAGWVDPFFFDFLTSTIPFFGGSTFYWECFLDGQVLTASRVSSNFMSSFFDAERSILTFFFGAGDGTEDSVSMLTGLGARGFSSSSVSSVSYLTDAGGFERITSKVSILSFYLSIVWTKASFYKSESASRSASSAFSFFNFSTSYWRPFAFSSSLMTSFYFHSSFSYSRTLSFSSKL